MCSCPNIAATGQQGHCSCAEATNLTSPAVVVWAAGGARRAEPSGIALSCSWKQQAAAAAPYELTATRLCNSACCIALQRCRAPGGLDRFAKRRAWPEMQTLVLRVKALHNLILVQS